MTMVPDTEVVGTALRHDRGPFSDRNGRLHGIIRRGAPGDNAPMVILELVDRVEVQGAQDGDREEGKTPKPRRRDRERARREGQGAAASA